MILPHDGSQTAAAGGDCGGELFDDVYTTLPVTVDCAVQVTFEPETVGDRLFANGFGLVPTRSHDRTCGPLIAEH